MGGVRTCRVTMAQAQRVDLTILALLLLAVSPLTGAQYIGKRIGALSQLQHDVAGEVYAVDSRTIHIKGFSYDGAAPDAFFYGGRSGVPSDDGFIIPDENGSTKPLGRYRKKDVTLTLPEGMTLKDVKWISVWCRAFAIDFGHVTLPASLQYPRPQKINALTTLDHGVTSDRIVVVDAQTFLIPNFNYDGAAPDAHFWVGRGAKPGPDGTVVPDENGSTKPLKRYEGKTIVITLPDSLTIFDIDYLSVWCKAFFSDFGNVRIPSNLNVPPSLKMLGVAPQTKLNCEVLYDGLALEVRWAVAGESIVMQLVGRVADGEYMAFGLSGSDSRSVMVGGDVVTAWLERDSGRGFAQDYFLRDKSQCQGGRGSCPDSQTQGSNDVRLLNAALINDFTMLTFQRPLTATDRGDRPIYTNNTQAVIWAVGPVNSEGHTSYHTLRSRGDMFVDFGRTPRWNCPLPDDQPTSGTSSSSGGGGGTSGQQSQSSALANNAPQAVTPSPSAWFIPPIPCYEPEDGVFYAQIGPTAGENGYNAITGHVGWGIAYYINGLLIPEINVVRGKSYTFVVEGGHDPANPSRSHPLYITDDPEGGYEFKTAAERSQVRVFAGVALDASNKPSPSAFGRLCEWKQDPNQPASGFNSFGAYQRTLNLDCQEGQPGILQWTPDANTPDTVYYQCYTHRFLGWKIRVHDSCDGTTQGSAPDYDDYYYDEQDGLTVGGSVNREMRVSPDDYRFESRKQRFKSKQASDSEKNREVPRRTSTDHDERGSPVDDTPENPMSFDSFPFNMDADRDRGYKRASAISSTPSLGSPEFRFPTLPPLRKTSNTVNATAIEKFRKEAGSSSNIFGPRPEDLNFSPGTEFVKPDSFMELMRTTNPFEELQNTFGFSNQHGFERNQPNPKYTITNEYNYLDTSSPLGRDESLRDDINPFELRHEPSSEAYDETVRRPEDIFVNKFENHTPQIHNPTSTSSTSFNFGLSRNPTGIRYTNIPSENNRYSSNFESVSNENFGKPQQKTREEAGVKGHYPRPGNDNSPDQTFKLSKAVALVHNRESNIYEDSDNSPLTRNIGKPVPVKTNSIRSSNHDLHYSNRGNPGFQPDSIVFESDFLPILTEESPGPPHLLGKPRESTKQSTHNKEIHTRGEHSNEVKKRDHTDVTLNVRPDNILSKTQFEHQIPSEFHDSRHHFRNVGTPHNPSLLDQNGPRPHGPAEIHHENPRQETIKDNIVTVDSKRIKSDDFFISGPAGKPHPLGNSNILPGRPLGGLHNPDINQNEFQNLNTEQHSQGNFVNAPNDNNANNPTIIPHQNTVIGRVSPNERHNNKNNDHSTSNFREFTLPNPPTNFVEGNLPFPLPTGDNSHFNRPQSTAMHPDGPGGRLSLSVGGPHFPGDRPHLPPGRPHFTNGHIHLPSSHPHLGAGPSQPTPGTSINPANNFGLPHQSDFLIHNRENINVGVSSHFKSPQDPPTTFGVHQLPPAIGNNLLIPGPHQRFPAHPMGHPLLPGGVPPRSLPGHRHQPSLRPMPGPRPVMNRRPPGNRRRLINPANRAFPNNRNQAVDARHRRTNVLQGDPMIALGSEQESINEAYPSMNGKFSLKRMGPESGNKNPTTPNEKVVPLKRASAAAKSGDSFLQNIWSTLTGSGSKIDSSNDSRNNAPKPKPRMAP